MADMGEKRQKAMQRVRSQIKEDLVKRDKAIVHAIKAVDEMDRSANMLFERFRDWHSVYWPELSQKAKDIDAYLEASLGGRPGESLGADLNGADLQKMMEYGSMVRGMRRQRVELEAYLDKTMEEEAPNRRAVCGTIIGARLISSAGSLKRMAEYPSSTIQVLGAEKALFAHLRKGTKSPKHGHIFAFPELRAAQRNKRGKIARKIANKVSIASRLDYFGGEFRGDRLRKDMEAEIKAIKGERHE